MIYLSIILIYLVAVLDFVELQTNNLLYLFLADLGIAVIFTIFVLIIAIDYTTGGSF